MATGATMQSMFGDGDSSDSDSENAEDSIGQREEQDVESAPSPSQSPLQAEPQRRQESDADNADEAEDAEDAEFDDNDGIIGRAPPLSAPPRMSQPSSGVGELSSSRLDEDSDSENDAAAVSTGVDKRRPPPPKEPRRMEVLDISRPEQVKKSKHLTFHMTKLPNFVSINSNAYDPATFSASAEEAEYRGYVHNMIRWRYKTDGKTGDFQRDENGKLIRESNTRVVKWSDGTYTLHVGGETFEMDELGGPSSQNSNNNGFTGSIGYLYLSQKATHIANENQTTTPGGTVLECMGPITSKMIPRPSSLHSEAHKNLTLAVRQRHLKKARIAEIVTQVDPEKEKMDRIKNKDDLNKQTSRGGARRAGGYQGKRRQSKNKDYVDRDDDVNYDSVNISALKRRNEMELMDYGNDGDDTGSDDDDWSKKKKAEFKKGAARRRTTTDYDQTSEASDEGKAMFQEDSGDEEEEEFKQAKVKKRVRAAVLEDDDDDDDDE